ncbi:right-handed parallel beta-helix repeat-containing protein [Haloarchaeobius sp. TZWWS8]|uniref:right-handed parallel beta-helix repeat-containing protein n=1 Tax=Haloarchaeobius sp. TZWWS8 TaxID=3446121 RepID=UPI003EB7949A
MREIPRRTFCSLLAASAATAPGWSAAKRGGAAGGPVPDGDDVVVRTRNELEAAFRDLSAGDSIFITAEGAPYRTRGWLDIDVENVRVYGPEIPTLVQPANGANVGGIRIGKHARVRDVLVHGVGYHGNRDRQSSGAERLHGISVVDAQNVILDGCQVRNTGPRSHGDGGSGISVTSRCSNVRISHNQISDFGDRGVQVAGANHVVFGNVIADGLDRPVSADLWDEDSRDYTALTVSVFGNLLGDSYEGSLVGAAQQIGSGANDGYLSVVGNVGFGAHKSFCHIRGPNRFKNVSIQNNVGHQDADGLETPQKTFAGIAIDPDGGDTLSIRNNELYDYSGRGIEINGDIRDLSVQQNTVSSVGLEGIRLVGASRGLVGDNQIHETGLAGIRLSRTRETSVTDNYVQRAGALGIRVDGGDGTTGNDVTGNYVVENGWNRDPVPPAIRVEERGVRVRGNAIRQNGSPAVVEDANKDAGANLVEANWADGERPWRIAGPETRVRGNTPAHDVHRGLSPDGDRQVSLRFDRPYADPPRLTYARGGSSIQSESYQQDGDGNVVGVTLALAGETTVVDVFVGGR